MPLNTKIQFRKGTSSEWSSANPILALGEPGFDSTNNQIRIGNGTSNWNSLPVMGAQGIQGIQGNQGVQGIQGPQGTTGIQGVQGIIGENGLSTGLNYFLNYSVSQFGSYKELSPLTASSLSQTVVSNLTSNQQNILVASFITNANDPGVLLIPNGIWHLYSYFTKPTSGSNITYYFTISKYPVGGPETLLVTSDTVQVGWDTNNTTPVETKSNAVITTNALNLTDRIVVKVYVNNNDNQARTVTFYTEDAHYSYLVTTFSTPGLQGIQGLQGSQGIQGNQGTQGVQGNTGSQGTQGIQGNQGVQGIQGRQGTQGLQGVLGTTGNTGSQGSQGTQGIQGLQGDQGVQGLAGSDANMQGTQGVQGEQGAQGIQGDQGIQGLDGIQGYEGLQGIQGIQGEQGIQGIQGLDGIQGPVPTLNFRGEYQSGTTYYLNDIVAYGNFAYAAIQNNFSFIDPTNSSYWAAFITQAIQGIQGIQGEGAQGIQGYSGIVNWTGEYSSMTTYYYNDGVSYNGSSYVAIQSGFSSTDPTNSSYWQLVAAQGTQGIQGESIQGTQGDQGIQGLDGIQGIQGSIPILNFRGEYNSWTTYYLNDIVAYGFMAYAAIQNGFSSYDPTNTSYWTVFITQTIQGIQGIQGEALQGIQGNSGVVNWTGEYSSMTTYYYNDGVSYNGSSYVAIQSGFSSTDPTNSSFWQLVAQAIQGIQGIQGSDASMQGTQGIQGELPAIGGAANNVIYRDGSSVITGENDLSYINTGTYSILTVGGGSGFGIAISADPTATNNSSIVFQGNNVTGSIDTDESAEYINLNGSWVLNNYAIRSKLIDVFTPLDNQPPASNFATLDTRNSIAVLDFDDTTQESAVFVGFIPGNISLTSGIIVTIYWMATSATTGNVRWGAQFEKMNTDTDSDSFAAATEAHTATNGTSGIISQTSITCTTIDSLATGDLFRVKIYRDTTDTTNDTMTGDAEIVAIVLTQAAT